MHVVTIDPRPITEVKQRQAMSVFGWVTAEKSLILPAIY
jgi:hypothetical protein